MYKSYKILQITFYILFLVGCSTPRFVAEKNVLLDQKGWTINSLGKGLTQYQFPSGYMEELGSYQNVNVLVLNPKKSDYKLKLYNIHESDSLSSTAINIPNAVAAINGTYFEKDINNGLSTSYLKIDNQLIDSVEAKPGNIFNWKHEGALCFNEKKAAIVRGNNTIYSNLKAENIISGSPLLIENYHLSGTHFARQIVENLDKLNYEDPDRHQGVRHPRTAVAILGNGSILFAVVDGRNEKASGMTANELTIFLKKYFNPKDALNLDGGGSSTFWIRNAYASKTGVINYPTDNKKWDHNGQRKLRNGFLILKKK